MKKVTITLIALCMVALAVCAAVIYTRPAFESITPQEFSELISSQEVVLVDVRTPQEYDSGHIPGTMHNIDVKDESFVFKANALLSKDVPVAIYCRSGNRSKTAAELLAKEGYKVYELATGFKGWIEAGYEQAEPMIFIDKSHDGLTVFYPMFDSIDLVCGQHAPNDDKNAIFCCAASFTGSYLEEFDHFNVAGNHVSGGKLYKGYSCRPNTGAFVWYNGQWKFLLHDYSAELKAAAAGAGMGFGQNMIIHDGVEQPLFRSNSFQYRALCELNGELCVIQSDQSVPYRTFVDMLKTAGVKHAIYLDMGGWSHAWYRKFSHAEVSYISVAKHNYYTNWLTFYIGR